MSNSSPAGNRHGDATADPSEDGSDESRTLEVLTPKFAQQIRAAGFWGAIVLPVLYLPVLANGLSSSLELGLFLGLIALNLVALYVGHAHRRRG